VEKIGYFWIATVYKIEVNIFYSHKYVTVSGLE